jgi:DNA-binding LacI/PurR family transcriptional regulator
MATIRDVAQKANVHPSTVSRVFSGHPRISEATRDRVLAVADELGFRPNAIARSLSTQQTNTIGIVIPHVFEGFFHDSFFPQIMRGMLEASYQNGFRLIVGGSEGYQDEFEQIKQITGSSQADGIVVMSSRVDVDTVGCLQEMNMPFVLIGHPPSKEYQDISWVDANNHLATKQAVDYLISLGHRKIAYVGGDPDNLTTQEREKAYTESLTAAGITPQLDWIAYAYFDEPGGYETALRMQQLGETAPTAYYAANDLMAVGVLRALNELQIDVPDQVSVFGTNNAPFSAYTHPALSSIDVPYAEMAHRAVELLITQINNKTSQIPRSSTVDCSLIIRESTGKSPAGTN